MKGKMELMLNGIPVKLQPAAFRYEERRAATNPDNEKGFTMYVENDGSYSFRDKVRLETENRLYYGKIISINDDLCKIFFLEKKDSIATREREYERILKLLNCRNGNRLALRYGFSQGYIDQLKKNEVGKPSGFWMRLALDCLEEMPEWKRQEILEKREKKA